MSHVYRCQSCAALNRVDPAKPGPVCARCHTPLVAKPAEVDDDQLERLIASSPVPVLVDFWAPWCGPCRVVAPRLEQLAQQRAGTLIIAKVNVDTHQRMAAKVGVQGIPLLALYQGGQLVRQQAGALDPAALARFVGPA